MRYEFWVHNTTGDVYAVALQPISNAVALVSEPLRRREVEQQPDPSEYHLTDDDAEWMNEHQRLFGLYEPQA